MHNINQNELKNASIAITRLAEQEHIVKRVEQLLSLCDALNGCLQSAEEEWEVG